MTQKGGPFLNMIGTQQDQIINKQKTNTTSTKNNNLCLVFVFMWLYQLNPIQLSEFSITGIKNWMHRLELKK